MSSIGELEVEDLRAFETMRSRCVDFGMPPLPRWSPSGA